MPPLPSAQPGPFTTPLTRLLRIRHPILLAGMHIVSSAPLAAAVTRAGGLGTLGGLTLSPAQLRAAIHELKALLPPSSSEAPAFGVDLALPQIGAGARKTNHDYTRGALDELIGVVIDEGARLFVSAVGAPLARLVARLHAAGVVVATVVGRPEHARKAFERGCDVVVAQGGEGGGHTGTVPTSVLVPACADVARGYRPAMLRGGEGLVVAAGGIYDGRGLAGALVSGASGVWVGTRFVASAEAGGSRAHREAVVGCGWDDTVRTEVVTGRPLRVRRNGYIEDWEGRGEEVQRLVGEGVVPMERDLEEGSEVEVEFPFLMGQVAGAIEDVKPAERIVEDMVRQAEEMLRQGNSYLANSNRSKL